MKYTFPYIPANIYLHIYITDKENFNISQLCKVIGKPQTTIG